MQVKDLPVIILAAGLSKRFHEKHRITHKSLLKIDPNTTIFDMIVSGLLANGVTHIIPILGYKSSNFEEYLSNKCFSSLTIMPILANEDYIHGPGYTILSIIPKLSKEFEKILVIPSDTIVHPHILQQIFSSEIESSDDYCHIFTISCSSKQISQYDNQISFNAQTINSEFNIYPLGEKVSNISSQELIIPILILSRSFLQFLQSNIMRISNKIIQYLSKYFKNTGFCSIIRISYNELIPPFIDIDTSKILNTLNSVKKELITAYKIK